MNGQERTTGQQEKNTKEKMREGVGGGTEKERHTYVGVPRRNDQRAMVIRKWLDHSAPENNYETPYFFVKRLPLSR